MWMHIHKYRYLLVCVYATFCWTHIHACMDTYILECYMHTLTHTHWNHFLTRFQSKKYQHATTLTHIHAHIQTYTYTYIAVQLRVFVKDVMHLYATDHANTCIAWVSESAHIDCLCVHLYACAGEGGSAHFLCMQLTTAWNAPNSHTNMHVFIPKYTHHKWAALETIKLLGRSTHACTHT